MAHGPGIDEPICLIDGADADETCFYHFDGLGSVVALCDVNNVLVERYAYDVFGRPTIRDVNGAEISASAVNNPYLFTGRRYDVEAGLYYYRARYYDFATGRFLQPDPLGYTDSLNLYAYVKNNPVRFMDPSGLYGEETHNSFGEYGGTVFDYSRLDRDYHPHSIHIFRHFRSRYDVWQDLGDACRQGDATAFEYHMHELQDTYSHGKGVLGILEHVLHGHALDDPDRNMIARMNAHSADYATRQWERIWDAHNPDYVSPWEAMQSLERFQLELADLEALLARAQPLLDWCEREKGNKK